MLWQAICAVIALGLLLWFAYVNPDPVPVYGTPRSFVDLPVWIVGCIGAVVGILLEFALTRRLWQAQKAVLGTAQSQLRRARSKAKSQAEALTERNEKIKVLEAQIETGGEPLVSHDEDDRDAQADAEEDDEEIGI